MQEITISKQQHFQTRKIPSQINFKLTVKEPSLMNNHGHKYKQKLHSLMPKFAVYVLWNLQYKSN